MKLAGKNATAESPSLVLIPGMIPILGLVLHIQLPEWKPYGLDWINMSPGGPGGSGVDLLLAYAPLLGQMLGEEYNFISYDPRGVNNSGLVLDCFQNNTEARVAFTRLHRTGVTKINASSTSLATQFYSASIYGEWCNDAVENGGSESRYGYYVTTPAAAHDLLTFIEAEARLAGRPPADAKLWAYGVSYGTVVGSTLAAMFPDRVGRMVLDGVLDAELYYGNEWRGFVDQADEAMGEFVRLCYSAGPERCSFWGPSMVDITDYPEAAGPSRPDEHGAESKSGRSPNAHHLLRPKSSLPQHHLQPTVAVPQYGGYTARARARERIVSRGGVCGF
jgi:pimeloyl-ACP methyl ester carboxylesterase